MHLQKRSLAHDKHHQRQEDTQQVANHQTGDSGQQPDPRPAVRCPNGKRGGGQPKQQRNNQNLFPDGGGAQEGKE